MLKTPYAARRSPSSILRLPSLRRPSLGSDFTTGRRGTMVTTAKDGGRNDRLSWSKRAEHRLREELKEIALKRCDDSVAKFAACAREKGMMVVFSCREQNKTMNACLNLHTNEDSFEQYKFQREQELHRDVKSSAPPG